jgi:CheY-like chemotaxis protein/signal transduction histidine kinase
MEELEAPGLDDIALTEATNDAPIAVAVIGKKDEFIALSRNLARLNPRLKTTFLKSGPEVADSCKCSDFVIIECRLTEVFEDLQVVRSLRAVRPLLPIIAISANQDPEFAAMVFDAGVTCYLPEPVVAGVMSAQILSLYTLSESSRIMEIKNNELVDTMRSLREANEELKIATAKRIKAERQKAAAEKEAEIHRHTKEILDNLNEGFFTIDASLKIGDSISQACRTIFDSDIGGKLLGEALSLAGDTERCIKLGVQQIFEDIMPASVTLSSIPKKVKTISGKTVDLTFTIVQHGSEPPTKIIVSAVDITAHMNEKNLMQRRDAHNRCLIGILKNVASFRSYVHDFKRELTAIKESQHLTDIKRFFHTIKGNSGAFGLDLIVKRVQLVENRLAEFEGLSVLNRSKISHYAAIVEKDMTDFLSGNHDILQISYDDEGNSSYSIEPGALDELGHIAADASFDIKERLDALVYRIKEQPVQTVATFYRARVERLSDKLSKNIECSISGRDLRINTEFLGGVLSNLIHPITNACDHGIETPEQREAVGKPPVGRCDIKFEKPQHGYLLITLEDDGRGIDGEKLRAAAVEKGVLSAEQAEKLGQQQQYELIFLDQVSTADSITEISGRGVGMAALKSEVDRLQGSITVSSKLGEGTKIEIFIPYPPVLAQVANPQRAPRVLICEEENTLLEMYGIVLENAGFNTTLCNNGFDLLVELSRHRYDVLVTDLRRPDSDAHEAISRIRKVRNDNDHMPILIISDKLSAGLSQTLRTYPNVLVFEKPIRSQLLVTQIAQSLATAAQSVS